MALTSLPAAPATQPLTVDLDCSHQVTIQVPALTTDSTVRASVALIDETIRQYRRGAVVCTSCAPSPTPDARDMKARRLLRTAGQWAKVRDRQTGRAIAYGIPSASRPGVLNLSNGHTCTCPDATFRGQRCYHARAVALHVQQLRASRAPQAA